MTFTFMEFDTEDKGKYIIFIYIFIKIKLINILKEINRLINM